MVKMKAASRKGMVVTSCALDEESHRRLAIAAIEEHAAITELIRHAVRDWLDRRDAKRRKR